jgi:hypothetical protein
MTGMSPAFEDALLIEVLIAFFILIRGVRTYYGRLYSTARVLVFPFLAVFLWLLAEAETAVSIAWSFPIFLAIDAVLVVVGAVFVLPFASRVISVYRGPDGQWMYRYGIELIGFYLGSWVVRFALAAYFDPSSLEFTVTTGPPLSAIASDVMLLVEALLSISTGLVIGRSIGTYRLYRQAIAQPAAPSAPLP